MKTSACFGFSPSRANCLQAPLLLVIRLYWGWQFMQTGWGKLTHLGRTASYFADLHIPAPGLNAFMAGGTECLGGLLLLLGLGSRYAAVPLIFTMGVAYLTAERDALRALTSDPDKFVSAAPFLFLLAAMIVLAFGPGPLSLDAIFCRRNKAAAS